MERIRANQGTLSILAITMAIVLVYSLVGAYLLGADRQSPFTTHPASGL